MECASQHNCAVFVLLGIACLAKTRFELHEIQEWQWESWRMVKQIFPHVAPSVPA